MSERDVLYKDTDNFIMMMYGKYDEVGIHPWSYREKSHYYMLMHNCSMYDKGFKNALSDLKNSCLFLSLDIKSKHCE